MQIGSVQLSSKSILGLLTTGAGWWLAHAGAIIPTLPPDTQAQAGAATVIVGTLLTFFSSPPKAADPPAPPGAAG